MFIDRENSGSNPCRPCLPQFDPSFVALLELHFRCMYLLSQGVSVTRPRLRCRELDYSLHLGQTANTTLKRNLTPRRASKHFIGLSIIMAVMLFIVQLALSALFAWEVTQWRKHQEETSRISFVAKLPAVTPARHPRPAIVALLAISRIRSCPGVPQAAFLPRYIAVIVFGKALTSWP